MLKFFFLLITFFIPLTGEELAPTFVSAEQGKIEWVPLNEPEVNYWVYGGKEETFCLDYSHLIDIVRETNYPLLQELPFYRIVAEKEGEFSPPSSLIIAHEKLAYLETLAVYPALDYEKWQLVAPYLLPERHPIKKKLDKIFKSARVSADLASFQKAGFITHGVRGWSHTVVALHPELKGVYLKLFFDNQSNIDDLARLMLRIKGADKAREVIAKNGWQSLFTVPRKWLYILPEKPVSSEPYPKTFVLVAEDMHLLSRKDNYAKWREDVDENFLNIVFRFITEGGFADSVYPFNLPFSKDGRVAVIDTEIFSTWPIPYHRFLPYLRPSRAEYWNLLIQSNGNQHVQSNAN